MPGKGRLTDLKAVKQSHLKGGKHGEKDGKKRKPAAFIPSKDNSPECLTNV